MKVDAFDFDLPPERIAQKPVQPKDRARLLVVEHDVMRDDTVLNLADFLEAGDIIVFNDTRVIPARMNGKRGEAGIEFAQRQQRFRAHVSARALRSAGGANVWGRRTASRLW